MDNRINSYTRPYKTATSWHFLWCNFFWVSWARYTTYQFWMALLLYVHAHSTLTACINLKMGDTLQPTFRELATGVDSIYIRLHFKRHPYMQWNLPKRSPELSCHLSIPARIDESEFSAFKTVQWLQLYISRSPVYCVLQPSLCMLLIYLCVE